VCEYVWLCDCLFFRDVLLRYAEIICCGLFFLSMHFWHLLTVSGSETRMTSLVSGRRDGGRAHGGGLLGLPRGDSHSGVPLVIIHWFSMDFPWNKPSTNLGYPHDYGNLQMFQVDAKTGFPAWWKKNSFEPRKGFLIRSNATLFIHWWATFGQTCVWSKDSINPLFNRVQTIQSTNHWIYQSTNQLINHQSIIHTAPIMLMQSFLYLTCLLVLQSTMHVSQQGAC